MVDGTPTLVYPRMPELGYGVRQYPWINNPMFVILSMQIGGSWVGEPVADQYPIQLNVDYVRVYSSSMLYLKNADFSIDRADPTLGGWTLSPGAGYSHGEAYFSNPQASIKQTTTYAIVPGDSYKLSATSSRNYGTRFEFYYDDNGTEVVIATSDVLTTSPRSFQYRIPDDASYGGKKLGIRIVGSQTRNYEQIDNVTLERLPNSGG